MKNIFSILTVTLAMAIAPCALAADTDATMPLPSDPVTVVPGGTNKAAALSTNAFFSFGVPDSTDAALWVEYKYLNAVGAGDHNGIDLELFRGIDASTFESNVWQTIRFAAGTTTTTSRSTCTNLSLAGIPYVRGRFLNLSTNAHATNITVKVKPKIPAFRSR